MSKSSTHSEWVTQCFGPSWRSKRHDKILINLDKQIWNTADFLSGAHLMPNLCGGLPGHATFVPLSPRAALLQQPWRSSGPRRGAGRTSLWSWPTHQPGDGILQDTSPSLAAALMEWRCQPEQQAAKRALLESGADDRLQGGMCA